MMVRQLLREPAMQLFKNLLSVPVLPKTLSLAVAAGMLVTPLPALACGGLFCQTQPVEQNAERILFEVNPDGTISAIVEITFTGSASDFSWVVPVPDTPTVDVVPQSTLSLLDTATVPQIIPPPTTCTNALFPPMMGGASNESDSAAFDGDDDDSGVDVVDLPAVGPYDDIRVVSSEDPQALIDWLQENQYLITAEMEPFVANYVEQGYKFLGMKLAPGAGTQDIAPVKITFPSDQPMVPIVLTSVSAEPEMGVLVFVAANERYEADNFENLVVDRADVQMNPRTQQNNYYALASWMVDQAGGQAFITENAQPAADVNGAVSNIFLNTSDSAEAQAYVTELLQRRSYLTRLYTRVSGWEMLADPYFQPSAGADVSRSIDLSDRPAVEMCAPSTDDTRKACGDMYCGVGAQCATTREGIDGCICPAGTVARSISAPLGLGRSVARTVTCQVTAHDMLASAREDGTAPQDPCLNASCGANGQCVDTNGFATCTCDEGYAAVTDPQGALTCSQVRTSFGPESILWEESGCACSSVGSDSISSSALALLLLAPLARLRRRREVN